jgi:hypothetical protein
VWIALIEGKLRAVEEAMLSQKRKNFGLNGVQCNVQNRIVEGT